MPGLPGRDAHATEEPPIYVIETRYGNFRLNRLQMLTLAHGIARSFIDQLRLESDVFEDDEQPVQELDSEELAELLAEAFELAVEQVRDRVKRMEKCVRKRGLTSQQRKDTANHGIRWTVGTAHAVYHEGTYYSVYNPFRQSFLSGSGRRDRTAHENAHHVTAAEKNNPLWGHKKPFWTRYREIRSLAYRCAGS
ncbi:MAG: hypothetical protein OXK76_03425 [Gammaproteobacteria bacterium]|nr:hypothetical protein [Gammaproteobacteria bacterium]